MGPLEISDVFYYNHYLSQYFIEQTAFLG